MKWLHSLLKVVFYPVSVGFLFYFFMENIDQYKTLISSNKLILFSIFFCIFAITIFGSIPTLLYLKKFSINLTVFECYSIFIMTSSLNYLPLKAGMIGKGIILKKKHSLSYSRYLAVTLSVYLFSIFYQSMSAVFVMAYHVFFYTNKLTVLLVFLSAMLASLSTIVVTTYFGKWLGALAILKKIPSIFPLLGSLNRDRAIFLGMFWIIIFHVLFSALKIYFLFDILSFDISLEQAVVISVLAGLSGIISLTPGNLGFQELATSLAYGAMGGVFENGLSVAIADRLLTFLVIALSAGIILVLKFKGKERAANAVT